VGSDGEYAV